MLTPVDLQGKTFKSGMGYSKADVDSFFSTLTSDYEALYRENMELKDKVGTLNEGINHYRSIEKSLQKALVLAEQTAEETISSAKTNATVIEQEAVLKAQSIVADAKIELDHIHAKTVEMLQQYERYRSQFRALAQAQVELLDSESFNIEVASLDAFSSLEQEAAQNTAAVHAKVQFQETEEKTLTPVDTSTEDEDETLNEDDIQINDLASLFADDSHSDETQED
ncbi:MAG TPA: DivIVA domain-containing protein [Candidatus Scybalocola faecavium]|nr:DivIVA domain-containing protein [Candidatus Scybalocola faecavium]